MSEPRQPVVIRLVPPPAAPVALADRDDDALMTLAAGGHRAAFEVLAARHLGPIARYSAKFLGDPRTAEEIAQDVLLEAWLQRQRYRGQGRFRTFLFTVARTRCLNALRWRRRRLRWLRPVDPPEDLAPAANPAEGADPLERLLEGERQRRVRDGLLALPPGLREAALLRFDQGLEYAEIARIVGRPEATIRSRVFHALKRLREAVKEEP